FSGRLSLSEHPWLADHKAFDRVILPGTGMMELALAAGLAVGSPRVLELTLAVPLVLPASGGLRVQVQVEAADAQGHRAFSLHSRDEAGTGSGGWTRHAMGVLAAPGEAEVAAIPLLEDWPPAGAASLDVADLYARLSGRGLDYGPVFQGLTGAWRLGNVLYGHVALPAGAADAAGDYGIHPALFDAALHVLAAADGFDGAEDGGVLLPFAWSDVRLHARGASELRVRVELPASGSSDSPEHAFTSMVVCDGTGQPVATVGGLTLRRATAEQVRAAMQSAHEDLYRVSWHAVPMAQSAVAPEKVVVVGGTGRLAAVLGVEHIADVAALCARLDAGGTAPERVIVDEMAWRGSLEGTQPAIELPSALQSETARVLGEVQALLSDARLAPAALLWVTSSAISTGADDGVDDLVHAPLWGLLRSTRNEHSDRVLRLLDVEGEEPTGEQLWPLLAADGEPEL
ncbi:MAG: polyketide synthase dehydratase domain-containing protein, partial [Bradyrhizobium sp.]|nr:polyketide synthase dehydratase domain-containing protein [Bradyrhizobium sp.]